MNAFSEGLPTVQHEMSILPPKQDLITQSGKVLQETMTRLNETGLAKEQTTVPSQVVSEVTRSTLDTLGIDLKSTDLSALATTVTKDQKLLQLSQRLVRGFNTTIDGIVQRTGLTRNDLLRDPKKLFSLLKLGKNTRWAARAALLSAPFLINDLLPKSGHTGGQDALAATILMSAFIGMVQPTAQPDLPVGVSLADQSRLTSRPDLPHNVTLPPEKKPKKPGRHISTPNIGKLVTKGRLLGCAAILAICGVCTTFTYIQVGRGEAQDAAKKAEPTLPPPSYEQRQLNRAKDTYDYYQKNPETYDPTTLTPAIEEQLIPYSWDWWLIKDPNQLYKAFQGKVDRSDIDLLAADPEYFYTILGKMKTKAESSGNKQEAERIQKLIDLYKKREEINGTPEQFLNQTNGSFLAPDIEKQHAIEAINRLKSIGERPYGRTGLSKREALKRQGYKV